MNLPYIDKILSKKPIESYPSSVINEIRLLSFYPKDLATPFGSYIYRMQKYAGDIDLLERFEYKTELSTIQQFVKALKRVIHDIGPYHYFSEFKAGLDHEYDIDIGKLDNGIYYPNPALPNILKTLYYDELISLEEYEYIDLILANLSRIPFSKKSMAYDTIYNIFREKRILRWTKEEILQGYKMIRGKKYTLAKALRDKTIVKIDLIVLVNNKFVEVTNILSLSYLKNGDSVAININDDELHSIDGLKAEVEKLYYSNKYYSPLKMCKRIYAMSRHTGDYRYIQPITKILRGDISLLYQIKSEMEAFIIILERVKTVPMTKINNQLSEIKGRLNTVLDISNEDIIKISIAIDKIISIKNKKEKLQEIKTQMNTLKKFIADLTINKLNLLEMNPPPQDFLPLQRKYARDIVRQVGERPTDEFKKFENNFLEYLIEQEKIRENRNKKTKTKK